MRSRSTAIIASLLLLAVFFLFIEARRAVSQETIDAKVEAVKYALVTLCLAGVPRQPLQPREIWNCDRN